MATLDPLIDFAHSLINRDRAKEGILPVNLSPVASAQVHANSMLRLQYFSHWDENGFKPYMRHSKLGSSDAVFENVATAYATGDSSSSRLRATIERLEWDMINDDSASNNMHRYNILDPNHNRVSIGIAFDRERVYFVQDFENSYLALSRPIVKTDCEIELRGPLAKRCRNLTIAVCFDEWPSPMNLTQLRYDRKYGGGYSMGDSIGEVLPQEQAWVGSSRSRSVQASLWRTSPHEIGLRFSLSSFVELKGKGMYTICMFGESDEKAIEVIMSTVPIDRSPCSQCGLIAGPRASFCRSCGQRIIHDQITESFSWLS